MIAEFFPINLASRTLAFRMKNNIPNTNKCNAYMTNAQVPADNVTTICQKYDFTNITDVNLFVSGTWYKDTTAVKAGTDMTDTQLTAFYDISDTGSFGYALMQS